MGSNYLLSRNIILFLHFFSSLILNSQHECAYACKNNYQFLKSFFMVTASLHIWPAGELFLSFSFVSVFQCFLVLRHRLRLFYLHFVLFHYKLFLLIFQFCFSHIIYQLFIRFFFVFILFSFNIHTKHHTSYISKRSSLCYKSPKMCCTKTTFKQIQTDSNPFKQIQTIHTDPNRLKQIYPLTHAEEI